MINQFPGANQQFIPWQSYQPGLSDADLIMLRQIVAEYRATLPPPNADYVRLQEENKRLREQIARIQQLINGEK